MKKLFILAIIIIVTILSGCHKANNTSSDISSAYGFDNSSLNISSENNESDGNVISDISSKVESSNTSETVSNVESKPTNTTSNTSSISKPVETNSNTSSVSNPDNGNTNISNESKPADNTSSETKPAEPQYKTIQLDVVTTYYGYTGYFTLSQLQSDVHLTELGIGDNTKASIAATEYKDVNSNQTLRFVFEGTIIEVKDLMYNHVYPAGAGKTFVKVLK